MKGRKGSASNTDEGLLIGDKYKLTSDKYNIILWEKKTITGTSRNPHLRNPKNIGAIKWIERAYFSLPKDALEYFVNNEIKETGFKDFETVVEKQNELYALIQGLPDNIMPQLKR